VIPDSTSRVSDAHAAAWDARLRSYDCTPDERARFAEWLKEDVENKESFDRLQAALSVLRKAADHPQLRGLRESARMVERRSTRFRVHGRAAIAAGVATIAASVFWLLPRELSFWPPKDSTPARTSAIPSGTGTGPWSTGVGERRTVALADGSSVTLNASTRLEAEWLPGERRIRLLTGQALFRVSKDPSRPFVVSVGQRTVTALGTTFDVRLTSAALQVTLIEGRVAVNSAHESTSQPAVELTPGQQFEVNAGDVPRLHRVDAAAEAAWSDGQVIFTDESLPDAVIRMNQYSKKEVIAGPELAKFHVNGMFRAGDQDGFVAAVTSYYPIASHVDSRGRIVLESR
jgi:transmembrane sensor